MDFTIASDRIRRTFTTASARASATRSGATSAAKASIAARKAASDSSSSGTARTLARGATLTLALGLDHLGALGVSDLLLTFSIGLLDHLAMSLLDDHLLPLARRRQTGELLEAVEPCPQILILLLELLGVARETRVRLPPIDAHLLRPLDRGDQ